VDEEDGTRDVEPATRSVRLGWVVRQVLEQLRLTNGLALQHLDVVGTPCHEKRHVEDNERGGTTSRNYQKNITKTLVAVPALAQYSSLLLFLLFLFM